jgi:dihydrofolate synthase/folylpolyglutamate synthase
LTEIAGEKAGILKPGVPLVLAPQHPEALIAIRRRAAEVGLLILPSENWQVHRNRADLHGQCFDLEQATPQSGLQKSGIRKYGELFLPLLGWHQLENAAFALTALERLREEGFVWEDKHLRQAWANLRWPGRAEVLQEGPLLVIDAAHNPDKATALALTIRDYFSFRHLALVFGASSDKDSGAMLALFTPWQPRLFATQAQSERALAADRILALGVAVGMPGNAFSSVAAAVQGALRWAGPQDMVLVTGSTYVAGEARDLYCPADANP